MELKQHTQGLKLFFSPFLIFYAIFYSSPSVFIYFFFYILISKQFSPDKSVKIKIKNNIYKSQNRISWNRIHLFIYIYIIDVCTIARIRQRFCNRGLHSDKGWPLPPTWSSRWSIAHREFYAFDRKFNISANFEWSFIVHIIIRRRSNDQYSFSLLAVTTRKRQAKSGWKSGSNDALFIFILFVSRWRRNESLYLMESSYGLSNSEIQPPIHAPFRSFIPLVYVIFRFQLHFSLIFPPTLPSPLCAPTNSAQVYKGEEYFFSSSSSSSFSRERLEIEF